MFCACNPACAALDYPIVSWSVHMARPQQEMPDLNGLDDTQRFFLRMIARIMTISAGPLITDVKTASTDGDVIFSVCFQELGIAESDVALVRRALRDRFYVDFVGELLLRLHFQSFLEWLGQNDFYEMATKMARHRHFGVAIQHGKLFFRFHCSLLVETTNSGLRDILATVK